MKDLIIAGSTGSIGTQCLDVIKRNPGKFRVKVLTCGKNIELLKKQIEEFRPELAVVSERADMEALKDSCRDFDMEFDCGSDGLIRAAEYEGDIFFNSLVGMRGMVPTYKAIMSGKDIALANKETLVAGGSLIMNAAAEKGVKILPVDSEHSAIFQSIEGNREKEIKRIILTASGGPFRGRTREELVGVKPEQALKHPNWDMGRKISIDSATMMNKGLEVIEAKWLFDVEAEKIQVVVHPESLLHSAVEYADGAIIGEFGVADMRVPISYALGYPDRIESGSESLDFFGAASSMTFEKPDLKTFGCLQLAFDAINCGGTMPAVMNGANEVLVGRFLNGEIGFTDIEAGIKKVMEGHKPVSEPGLEEIIEADRLARLQAGSLTTSATGSPSAPQAGSLTTPGTGSPSAPKAVRKNL